MIMRNHPLRILLAGVLIGIVCTAEETKRYWIDEIAGPEKIK